jgi:type IV secretory pathway VirB3-like protein
MLTVLNFLAQKKTINFVDGFYVGAAGFEPAAFPLWRDILTVLNFFGTKKTINCVDGFYVGAAGFEPAASCSQSRHSNRAELRPERVII